MLSITQINAMSRSLEAQLKEHSMAMAWLQDHIYWLSLAAQAWQQDADPQVSSQTNND